MFGQQVGKLQQPLENMVVEDVGRRTWNREVYITISMANLPATKPIAKGVAEYARTHPKVGDIFVDSPDANPLNFERAFEDYLTEVSGKKPGELVTHIQYNFLRVYPNLLSATFDAEEHALEFSQFPLECVGTNAFGNPNANLQIWYLLALHGNIEGSFSVSEFKLEGHPQKDLYFQGVIGYRLFGDGVLIDETLEKILALVAAQSSEFRGVLTLNDVAYVKEAIAEFKFQAERLRNRS